MPQYTTAVPLGGIQGDVTDRLTSVCRLMWPQYGWTPVYTAAYNNRHKSIQLLIVAKADVNIASKIVSGHG